MSEFNKTTFIGQTIPTNAGKGVELGQGKCKAIQIVFPYYQRNTVNENTLQPLYYGSSQRQETELLRGETSALIYCDNLNEVHARAGIEQVKVEIIVYN